MIDITETALATLMESLMGPENQAFAVFFYTPLCGTCKLGEQMLQVVEATGRALPLYRINVNYAPYFREAWRVESVPCLVVLEQGKLKNKEYAMRDVQHLYRLVKKKGDMQDEHN